MLRSFFSDIHSASSTNCRSSKTTGSPTRNLRIFTFGDASRHVCPSKRHLARQRPTKRYWSSSASRAAPRAGPQPATSYVVLPASDLRGAIRRFDMGLPRARSVKKGMHASRALRATLARPHMGRHERRAAEGGDVARVRGADVGPAEEAEVLVEGAREAEAPEVARQPPRVEAALAVELEEPRHAPGLGRELLERLEAAAVAVAALDLELDAARRVGHARRVEVVAHGLEPLAEGPHVRALDRRAELRR
mmetsp:Transcript_3207/g.11049  ORF Transcript_3207/g.11049 Transcript_3207/m.11049 type:complete len:250 (-) Transcript_3207:578-1327(-)